MHKIWHFVAQSWLLLVAAFMFGLLLSAADIALAPAIEKNRVEKLSRLMGGLLPSAERFENAGKVLVRSGKGKERTGNLYRAIAPDGSTFGWAFDARGAGFADSIELVVAVDGRFETIAGIDCLASNETPGFGDRIKLPQWRAQFAGVPAGDLAVIKTGDTSRIDTQIVAITGATVSSDAVVAIINNSISQVRLQMIEKGLLEDGR